MVSVHDAFPICLPIPVEQVHQSLRHGQGGMHPDGQGTFPGGNGDPVPFLHPQTLAVLPVHVCRRLRPQGPVPGNLVKAAVEGIGNPGAGGKHKGVADRVRTVQRLPVSGKGIQPPLRVLLYDRAF